MLLAGFISEGYELHNRTLASADDIPGWASEVATWNGKVEARIEMNLNKSSVAVFLNDVDVRAPSRRMLDLSYADEKTHEMPRLRLAKRIQNLHQLMAGLCL